MHTEPKIYRPTENGNGDPLSLPDIAALKEGDRIIVVGEGYDDLSETPSTMHRAPGIFTVNGPKIVFFLDLWVPGEEELEEIAISADFDGDEKSFDAEVDELNLFRYSHGTALIDGVEVRISFREDRKGNRFVSRNGGEFLPVTDAIDVDTASDLFD